MTAAAALSLLGSMLKNLDTASLTLGDLSVSPFGMTVPVPRRVQRKTTVGEWVTRPIRTFVQVTRTVWKTITEAVPRFITRTRQVIDRIVRSEWVTTFKQIAKTFWEKVTEKVPLLGWLGKVIGFIWKTVIKPVIRWVTKAVRALRTWVENVIRWVVEKIRDGWNYITRQISETIREWVEKTDWAREWVTKEITVWETVWEQKFVAFPVPSGSSGLLAALTPQTWSNLLRALGAGTALATLAATASMCATASSDPCPTPTPLPPFMLTQTAVAWQMETLVAEMVQGTSTALALPSTVQPPAPDPTPHPLLYSYIVQPGDTLWNIANKFGMTVDELMSANGLTDTNLQINQKIIIPCQHCGMLDPIFMNLLTSDNPLDFHKKKAVEALIVFSNAQNWSNPWWLQDEKLNMEDALSIILQTEAANNPQGQRAVIGRYLYFCGTSPDCNGDTSKLLDFLSYYQPWREPGNVDNKNIHENPTGQITNLSSAVIAGNITELENFMGTTNLSQSNKDLPFHFANVNDEWNELLKRKLGRNPDGANKFWVLSINDLNKICGIDYGVLSPDMTKENIPQECQ